jgi:hypothetical protein
MSYFVVGSTDLADWVRVKKLCRDMRKEFNKSLAALETKLESEIKELNPEQIQTLKNQVQSLIAQMSTIISGQEVQGQRLDALEESCANSEITTSEIIEAYNGD